MTEGNQLSDREYPEGSVGRYVRERWGVAQPAATRPYVAPPAPRRCRRPSRRRPSSPPVRTPLRPLRSPSRNPGRSPARDMGRNPHRSPPGRARSSRSPPPPGTTPNEVIADPAGAARPPRPSTSTGPPPRPSPRRTRPHPAVLVSISAECRHRPERGRHGAEPAGLRTDPAGPRAPRRPLDRSRRGARAGGPAGPQQPRRAARRAVLGPAAATRPSGRRRAAGGGCST